MMKSILIGQQGQMARSIYRRGGGNDDEARRRRRPGTAFLGHSGGSAAYDAINTSDRGSEVAAGTSAAETATADNLHCIVPSVKKMIDAALSLPRHSVCPWPSLWPSSSRGTIPRRSIRSPIGSFDVQKHR